MCEKQGEDKKNKLGEKCNEQNMVTGESSYQRCFISVEDSNRLRRCFMTGEYCSKQMNIQRERREQHENDRLNAFVIMNFSDMSDVVYKWRIHDYIENLKEYFAFSNDRERIYCYKEKITEKMEEKDNLISVKGIDVVRADSDPASNYIICSRICQQMQIADLVIADVSTQNPNVFYELGMAVALGKMILPMCYSESYYKMVISKKVNKSDQCKMLEHHIDCYPWRKKLFEYYGIRFKKDEENKVKNKIVENNKNDKDKKENNENEDDRNLDTDNARTHYLEYDKATSVEYGFSDIKYSRFPYHEVMEGDKENIGKKIYDKLRKKYNSSYRDNNTLVVYTMDGF